ncbi:uncharacterized protein LOC126744892 isoform X6 [Anthonomus grandis grandis]|uniref:uncharacterized protein LOC126744892 isoform X6 n=1 Tax=Anthonomus grandis grandis TaxID=2921223 RepID=UPI0021654934|nr:uncharacterized protein LOC126744892 isoform X6 [Anthonomus grandis grandis]
MSGDDFATQFYNIQGIHFNERKKNFNKLLQSANQAILDKVEIKPRNDLEYLFYIDVLVKAKRVEPLIQILQDGNPQFTSRILKQRWFFEEAFKDTPEQQIVYNFLPSLSYSLRMKVLKKMALTFSDQRMDKLFDLILERYGISIAQQFLFSCSSEKIIETLQKNSLTLSEEQLKRFLQKDPELIKVYFHEFKKNTGRHFDDTEFIRYIVWKHPELYFELSKILQTDIKVGRRTTKSVLRLNQTDVLKEVELVQKFHLGAVIRNIKGSDVQILLDIFPKNIKELKYFSDQIKNHLKKIPKKKRFELFLHCFAQKYQVQLSDCLDKLNKQLMLYFSDKIDLVQKWSEINFKNTNDISYIEHLNPELAFQTVKDRMNFTSDKYDRSKLLHNLIKSCHFGKDYLFYKRSLNFLCYRSRNEEGSIRHQLMSTINSNLDINLTDDEFWKHINEMVEVSRAKKDVSLPFEILAKFIIYNFRKERPVDALIAQFWEDVWEDSAGSWTRLQHVSYFQTDPELHSLVLKYLAENCFKLGKSMQRNLVEDKSLISNLLDKIIKFNDDPKNKYWSVDLDQCLLIKEQAQKTFTSNNMTDEDVEIGVTFIGRNYLNKGLHPIGADWVPESDITKTYLSWLDNDKFWYKLGKLTCNLMKAPRTTQLQNELLDFYFNRAFKPPGKFWNQSEVVKYFLNKEPEVIQKYFRNILDLQPENTVVLDYSGFKSYNHLNWDRAVVKELVKCSQALAIDDNQKTSILKHLSKLMKTYEYIELIAPYIPDKPKLDLQDQQQKNIYEIQVEIVNKYLVNLSDNYPQLVPVLYNFCQGDYLQSTLRIVYKTLYRISELGAEEFIKVLMGRAVSTRKHALSLAFETLAQNTALDIFRTMSKEEKNDSAKKHLMERLVKYFIKNPEENLLNMVLNSLSFVNKNDKELLEFLAKASQEVIPKFRPMFSEKLFYFLDDMRKKEGHLINPYVITLFNNIKSQENDFYLNLSENFCTNILENYFLHDLPYSDSLTEFVAKYLWVHNEEKYFDAVFNCIKQWKDLYWNSNEKTKLHLIFVFFSIMFQKFLDKDWEFLNMFKAHWSKQFSSEETPKEHIRIDMLIIFKKHPTLRQFTKALNVHLQQIIDQYGVYFVGSLKDIFSSFFYANNAVERHSKITLSNVALELLRIEPNELNTLLAMEYFERSKVKTRDEIFAILKSIDKPFYRIKSNEFIKNYF